MLLVWNLETGKYEIAPIVFVDSDAEMEYEIIHLYFSDGSEVKVITEHGFFDVNLGKYVYIDAANYADYIGHTFVTEGDITSNSFGTATLENVVIEKEVTTAWSPVTFKHLCYYTNGVLSMPGGIDGLFNIFEVDTDTMRYDAEKMQSPILLAKGTELIAKQIEIVKQYLPTLMSREEIKNIILGLEDKSIGGVMKHFKTNYMGKCDMRLVGEVQKEI